jgi:hypothetical protein
MLMRYYVKARDFTGKVWPALTVRSTSWKRFSTAVHMSEVTGDVEQGLQKSEKTSVDTKYV